MRNLQSMGANIDRLYVLNGGTAVAPDKAAYSPGTEEGIPVALSCNAYLIYRKGAWILWDTGIQDDLYFRSGGEVLAHNIRGIVTRPIATQLHEIGVQPDEIKTVLLSHGHFDHVGNCNSFPHATFYLQRTEHETMFGSDFEKYGYLPSLYRTLQEGKVELLSGDTDLFGDGSVRMLSTPGHTPGHSSLFVNLRKSGPTILAADVAHYGYNFENRLVPKMNCDKVQSRLSMEKVESMCKELNAQLWLNHDIKQDATIPHAPVWFD